MKFSPLYRSILTRPFFILPRTAEGYGLMVLRLLEHDPQLFGSDAKPSTPVRACLMAADGRAVLATSAELHAAAAGAGGGAGGGVVAVVPLRGSMVKESTPCQYGTEELAQLMLEAARQDTVVGIVLDVDSGGGCVDAVAPLVQAITSVQQQGKPVVASCDLCASAAYYVACHCDSIIANNDISAEFGSIGVMTQIADYAQYYEQHGVKLHTIYSSLSEHKNAPFEAALKGDYKSIREEELDPLARQFQECVKQHRSGLDLKTEGLLSGRMFMHKDALRVGLIDQVGTMDTAVGEVRRRAADAELRRLTAG